MCRFPKRAILICIIYLHHLQSAVIADCPTDGFPPINWKFSRESTPPVDNVTQSLEEFPGYGKCLRVTGTNITQNITIFIFAMPYIKNEFSCPGRFQLQEHLGSLRRHRCAYRELPEESFGFDSSYPKIFTGCYYTAIQNDEGESWIVGPDYFETNYTYLDTNVTITKCQVNPEDTNKPKELVTELKVPLSCIKVDARLYEWKGSIGNVTQDFIMNEISAERTEPAQQCTISKVGNGVKTSCGLSKLSTNLTLEVVSGSSMNGTEWKAIIKWTNLPSGANTYYLRFRSYIFDCFRSSASDHELEIDLHAWMLIVGNAFCSLGYSPHDNRALPYNHFDWTTIVLSVVCIVIITILVYWIVKFIKLTFESEFKWNTTSGSPRQKSNSMHNEKESQKILLMYAKDVHFFMDVMKNLRIRLAQDCHCQVHDVYATDEWKMVGELGATGWVEKLLKNGSRVVWVDTPKFRSCLNAKQNRLRADDFRDDAVRYAVVLATDLFQNATTQYRRHFVVRVKGFEVDDGQEDPLAVVSPHARYHIPTHLSLLIEHLGGSPQSLENTTMEV